MTEQSCHRQVHWLLKKIRGTLHGEIESILSDHGLTLATYEVLNAFEHQAADYTPTHALKSSLPGRRPDVTRLIDSLERKGLVSRQSNVQDRRQILVGLTTQGKNLLHEVNPQVEQRLEELFGPLTAGELDQLQELLLQLERGLDDAPDARAGDD